VAGGGPGVPLYDRFFSGYGTTNTPFLATATVDSNDDLVNIDDLNCIARESSTSASPLTAQIGANTAVKVPPLDTGFDQGMAYLTAATNPGITAYNTAGLTFAAEPYEAALYFDFAFDPRAAYNAADASFGDPQVTVAGEIPPTFLSCTTLTDRTQPEVPTPPMASALPEGAVDLVRQAGKININTAGPDVLYSLFSNDGALWDGAKTPTPAAVSSLVDDAIGFRGRLAASSPVPVFAVTGTGSSAVASVTMAAGVNNYSTYINAADASGFRSTSDLLVAFLPTIYATNGFYANSGPPSTIQQRDAAWADVENFISIRSDTFAVYGLVQALRLNPNWANITTNYLATDWYNANQGTFTATGEGMVTTDPTSTTDEFILEGSRRFIAIVDRSYCNNGATVQPHIVALKILPQ
jgi:hypothetical protein